MHQIKYSSVIWGIYIFIVSLIWLIDITYTDPKYFVFVYFIPYFLGGIHALIVGYYLYKEKPETSREIALYSVICFFLLFWVEIISVYINLKIAFEYSTMAALGINICLSGGAIYLSKFMIKTLSFIWEKRGFLWIKIFCLSGIETVVLLYFHTFVAVRGYEKSIMIWLTYSDIFPNIGLIVVLSWFFGILLPQSYKAMEQAYTKNGRNNISYSSLYFLFTLLLMAFAVILMNIFDLRPQPIWWLYMTEENQVLWKCFFDFLINKQVNFMFIGIAVMVLALIKKQMESELFIKKERKVIKMIASLSLAISTHVFLGTVLYSAIAATARERNYDIEFCVFFPKFDYYPIVIEILVIFSIIVFINCCFKKRIKYTSPGRI